MKVSTVTKLVTIISVLLFCMAVGYYAFMHLDMTNRSRAFNLYSLVPADCSGILESDDISAFLHELPNLNYCEELENFQFPGLFHFIVDELNEHASENAHGLNSYMNRLLVSFHAPHDSLDQVIYFQKGSTDNTLLDNLFQEYMSGHFMTKEEDYRGETIVVYPLNHEEYLSVYAEEEFVVISFQKRLIEKVIDARLDENSLNADDSFSKVQTKKKNHFLTLYTYEPIKLSSDVETACWNEYDFHLNSDVVYLTGETYFPDDMPVDSLFAAKVSELPVIYKEGLFVVANKDSMQYYIGKAYEANDSDDLNLFNECVVNLSSESCFSVVMDMQLEPDNYRLVQPYLPSFLLEHSKLFSSFILSAQYTIINDRLSHIWTFTYKY